MKRSPRFRIGDKVKCLNADDCTIASRLLKLGEIYTIKSVDKNFYTFITLENVHTGKSYPVFLSERFELVRENPKTKLVKRYYKLTEEMNDIRSKLRSMYVKNPKSCEHCGSIIHWESTGRIDEDTGESLQSCVCYRSKEDGK